MANKDSEINSILLVIAMEQEALPLVRSLNLEMLSPLPFPFGLPAVAWKGKVGRSTVHLIWCGRYVLQYFVFYIFEYLLTNLQIDQLIETYFLAGVPS